MQGVLPGIRYNELMCACVYVCMCVCVCMGIGDLYYI
jgi:hypothetical protein